MVYLIAGICIVFFIGVIIFGIKVLRENRKMGSHKKYLDDDDEPRF